jgi:hypothetical protein
MHPRSADTQSYNIDSPHADVEYKAYQNSQTAYPANSDTANSEWMLLRLLTTPTTTEIASLSRWSLLRIEVPGLYNLLPIIQYQK